MLAKIFKIQKISLLFQVLKDNFFLQNFDHCIIQNFDFESKKAIACTDSLFCSSLNQESIFPHEDKLSLILHTWFDSLQSVPYRLDIYELFNRTSSRIVLVAAANGLAQELCIVLPTKVKIKNSTSSVYSSLYGIL